MTATPEGIIPLYERNAKAWDEDRSRALVEDVWLCRFSDLLPSNAYVLDIGCGGGEPIADYLIAQGCNVTGIDASPSMISICKKRFLHSNWLTADMRKLSLGRTFNGMIAWNSFFHLCREDQRKMFPIFRQHAAPDAALIFTSGAEDGEAIGKLRNEPLYHASLSNTEYCDLLDQNGFDVIKHVNDDPACCGFTVWLARSRN